MSVDVEVWVRRVEQVRPALFTASEEWQDDEGGELALVRDEWQLLVGSPEPADVGDADPAIAGYLDGSEQLIGIALEPIGAPFEAFSLLSEVVTLLVNRCGGAAIDVETGDGLSAP